MNGHLTSRHNHYDAYGYVNGNDEDDGYLVRVGPKEKEVERNGGNKVNYKPTPGQQHYCDTYCELSFQNKRNLSSTSGKKKLTELIRRIGSQASL